MSKYRKSVTAAGTGIRLPSFQTLLLKSKTNSKSKPKTMESG